MIDDMILDKKSNPSPISSTSPIMNSPNRRDMLAGMGGAGLSLATLLNTPNLAHAAAETLDTVQLTTQKGRSVTARLAKPDHRPAPAILLIHEWWGLNDEIMSMAAALAKEGYMALAVDLYDGVVAKTPEEARAQTQKTDPAEAIDTLKSWILHLRQRDDVTNKIGTLGWCFGGGWSLNASIATPIEATVVYYGRVTRTAKDLNRLHGPILGHFATQDQFINQTMVAGFEQEMRKANRTDRLTIHWYEANHAFANPTGGNYDKKDALLAWKRTLTFLDEHLRS